LGGINHQVAEIELMDTNNEDEETEIAGQDLHERRTMGTKIEALEERFIGKVAMIELCTDWSRIKHSCGTASQFSTGISEAVFTVPSEPF